MNLLLKLLLFIRNKKKMNICIILIFFLIVALSLVAMQMANDNPFIYFQF